LFKNSRITPAFRQKTLSNFTTEGKPEAVVKMYQTTFDYSENFGGHGENNWLVLLGEPGCGKTHLSMAVANIILDHEYPTLYFPHLEGMGELKETFNQSEVTLDERLSEMKKVHLLVWDDLFKGREHPTDWTLEIVFEVLNYRYLNLKQTIISSEKTPESLISIDKAIGSRILERGKGHIATTEGMMHNHRIT
jgi:DNA replication protein DnaC